MHDIIRTTRRVVSLDLGIAAAHTAQVLDEAGRVIAKRRVVPTVESFIELEQAALAGAAAGTRFQIVIELTGPAWLPVAVWFTGRHTVFRVSTQKSADLNRFLSRHAKSNSIDAHTLARLPMIDPAGLKPVALPATAQRAQLDRRVRASARLTHEIGERKVRIIELARQLMPTIGPVLSQKLSCGDLAVLERYADPRRLVAVRRARLVELIAKASNGHADSQVRADGFRAAARAAVELYGTTDAVAFEVIADEIATEISRPLTSGCYVPPRPKVTSRAGR